MNPGNVNANVAQIAQLAQQMRHMEARQAMMRQRDELTQLQQEENEVRIQLCYPISSSVMIRHLILSKYQSFVIIF